MKFTRYTIAAAALLMLSAGGLVAQETDTADTSPDTGSSYRLYEPGKFWLQRTPYQPWLAARFGWWGVSTSGSKAGIGEWLEPESGPFWDVDTLITDGWSTTNFFATGTTSDDTQIGLNFYGGPGLSLDFDYDRYIHNLPHNPLGGLPVGPLGMPPAGGFYNPPLPSPTPGYTLFGEDLTVDSDYAIRVQELKADFHGDLTENISWGLNLWGMRKTGTRQANSTQHCVQGLAAGNSTCHVVSQGQRIDWLTMEIEPVIEARFGWLTVEYSRTMRTFQQDDQLVYNDFTSFSSNYGLQGVGAYAYVPENFTQIDRIKLHGDLTQNTQMYVLGTIGNTRNEFRDSDRRFGGIDARITNNTFEGLTLTAYGKTYSQDTAWDNEALDTRYPAQAGDWLEANPPQDMYNTASYGPLIYTPPVNRRFTDIGFKARWRPFLCSGTPISRLAVTGGYEYGEIERSNAIYNIRGLNDVTDTYYFTQPNTFENNFFIGLQHKWSATFDSYIRYRMITSEYPLVGITERQEASLNAAINSNLPEHVDRVEIGGTWTPSDTLLVNGTFWLENSFNRSDIVQFDEDSYPIVISAWWSPSCKWSFNGGYATFSDWINQDITLGNEKGELVPPPRGGQQLNAWTSPWGYTGRSDVLNLGATYLATSRTRLTTGFEYVRGYNYFNAPGANPADPPIANADPPPATIDVYTDLPGYSAVRINTYRATAGVDYEWTDNWNVYFRYNLIDYDDIAQGELSGIAHMFLGGVSAVF